MFKTAAAALLIGVVVVGVSGCGSSRKPATTAQVSLTLPPGISQPFEIIAFGSMDALSASVSQYDTKCVRAQGYTVPDPPVNVSAGALIQDKASLGYLTEEEVRRNGLHLGPAPSGEVPTKPSAATTQAYVDCHQKTMDKLGGDYQKISDAFIDLTNQVGSEFFPARRVLMDNAYKQVRQCLVRAGWKPIDGDTLSDLSVDESVVFGVQRATPVTDASGNEISYVPLPREIDLGLAMLHCRLSLNLPAWFMNESIKLEAPIVAKYEQQIAEQNKQVEDLARRAAQVLT